MILRFHVAVQREVDEACLWYDERKDGLGDELFQEIERVLALIAENPKFFSPHTHGRRKAPLKRFPYGIYYRVFEDRVRILAILHDRRRPDYAIRRR